jgi:ubiquitin carboxyl-terminal hydrolase MINDY-1/2
MVTIPSEGSLRASVNPPYPVTPTFTQRQPVPPSSHSDKLDHHAEDDDEDDWEKDDPDEEDDWELADKPEDVPRPLHVEKQKEHMSESLPQIPALLRPSPPPGVTLRKSQENFQALASQISLPSSSVYGSSTSLPRDNTSMQSHNPFLRRQNTGEALFGPSSGSVTWSQASSSQPVIYSDELAAPVELPAAETPNQEFSQLRLEKKRRQEEQAPLIPVETEDDFAKPPNRHVSNASMSWNPGMDITSLDAKTSRGHRLPDTPETPVRTWQEQQDRERSHRERREREAEEALERAKQEEQMRRAEEEWHRGEEMHRSQQVQRSHPDEPVSPLIDIDSSPHGSPRPDAQSTPSRSAARKVPETYSIKQARWYDSSCSKLRTTPILQQNNNGPCPLLALVNALVMSTPDGEATALVETLRTREQVSLELLLQAVIDELISRPRQGEVELPDVGELHAFLKNLHTGMNVNPMFTFVPDRSSYSMHPAFRPKTAPGGFEETREMRLYSVFNVPLVHGWLPDREDPAYQAFSRSAKSYEEVQNILFDEVDLERKLMREGLSPDEQQKFQDLHIIKEFLNAWGTQITPYGLGLLHEHIVPGSFAILFRNDHFSTLYKEPRANQLMTLVTDESYASHDEIVWESLVDVSGQGTELFSGDFRPVSHTTQAAQSSSGGPPAGPRGSSLGAGGQNVQSMLDVDEANDDWNTVQRGRGVRRSRASGTEQQTGTTHDNSFAPLAPVVSKAEQEDHDLALALQLQEEEEARVRRESEARNRDAVLEPQSRVPDSRVNIPITGPGGPPPPRRSSGAPQPPQQNRPPLPVPPRRNREDEELPPPTYEQAAQRPAFVPPVGHPASPNAPVPAPGQQPQRPPSGPGFGRGGAPMGPGRGGYMGGPGRGRGIGVGRDDRDKCVVM